MKTVQGMPEKRDPVMKTTVKVLVYLTIILLIGVYLVLTFIEMYTPSNSLLLYSILYVHTMTINKVTECRDEKPHGWIDDAIYSHAHLCGIITCEDLAVVGSCSKDLSEFPLSNCVNGTSGPLSNYCKRSCHTCGK